MRAPPPALTSTCHALTSHYGARACGLTVLPARHPRYLPPVELGDTPDGAHGLDDARERGALVRVAMPALLHQLACLLALPRVVGVHEHPPWPPLLLTCRGQGADVGGQGSGAGFGGKG